jgi:uncharacterized protein (DUF697 family)
VAKLPISLSRSMRLFTEASASVGESASIVLAGDPALLSRAQARLSQDGVFAAGSVAVSAGSFAAVVSTPGDILVVLTTPDSEPEVEAALPSNLARGSVVVAVDEGADAKIRASYLPNGATRLTFSDSDAGWNRLFSLCVEASGPGSVALARRYPAVRQVAAERLVQRTAAQNAVIALVFFIPGSDMPAMTLNQARMVLNLAAMYGEPISSERAVEMIAVAMLGYGFRGVGRRLVRLLPGLTLLLKIATAYSATMAVGLGAIAYFEKGAPASTSKVIALAGSLKR